MKKIFSAILTVSILLCLAASAAFANSGGEGGDDSGGRALSAEEKRLVGN